VIAPVRLGLDGNVAVLDVHRKGLGDVRPILQFFAAFDRDRMGANLDALRVEVRLSVAHVEFPAVPRAAQEFADARALVDTGLRRGQPRDAGGLLLRRTLMRAAIEQRKELAVDVEHDDVAAVDAKHLVAAGRNV
jgi:hypothetical protein